MSQQESAVEVANTLRKAGFRTVECADFNFCLDTAACGDNVRIIVKLAPNVDKMEETMAAELRTIGSALATSSIIVGSKTQHGDLEADVVYERHGIPAVTLQTFRRILFRSGQPFIQAKRGGFFVALDGAKLREARENRRLSLGELAERVGVTRRAIYEYERMGMTAGISTVERLEDVLETDIALPQDILHWKGEREKDSPKPITGGQRNLIESLNQAGFRAYPLAKAPFDIVAKEGNAKIGLLREETMGMNKPLGRLRVARSIAEFLDTVFMVVTHRETADTIEGVPVVAEKALRQARDPESVIELAKQN